MNNVESTEITNNDIIEQEMNRKIVVFISFNKKIETTPKEIDEALGVNILRDTLLDETLSKDNKQIILMQQLNKYVESVIYKEMHDIPNKSDIVNLHCFGKTIEIENKDYILIRNFSLSCIICTLFVVIVNLTGGLEYDIIYILRCWFEIILYYYIFRFIRRGLDFLIK